MGLTGGQWPCQSTLIQPAFLQIAGLFSRLLTMRAVMGLTRLAHGVLPEQSLAGGVDMAPRSGAGAMTMVLDLVILSPIPALKQALS